MKKFNLLLEYPKPIKSRKIGKNLRTISHRIIASNRGFDFFDGNRNYGYGGFKYDGRWELIAKKIISRYNLKDGSNILQIASEKGFLLHEIQKLNKKINVTGLETSDYAISKSLKSIKKKIIKIKNFNDFKIKNKKFDFIIALGVIYTLNLADAISCIKQIQNLCNGNSFITLASYSNDKDYWLFKNWSLLGTLLLKESEWKKVLKFCNYTGDYFFVNAKQLSLKKN